MFTSTFFLALLGIVWLDLLLSGDNALVIALVCRQLPAKQQRLGMALGAVAAVVLRIVFAFLVSYLMAIKGLGVAGGLFLAWIAVRMRVNQDGEPDGKPSTTLLGAVVTIAIADAGMSLDNVMAIAALSHGNMALMALGVLISIPLVIAGSVIITVIINRLPIMIWAGAALLGWVAGGIIADDPLVSPFLHGNELIHMGISLAFACAVITIAMVWRGLAATAEQAFWEA